jgi:hypothetical protein
VRLRRPIPADRWWLTGEGGAGEEAYTKGKSWVAVGWMEAHHSGVSTAVVLDWRGNDGAGLVTARGTGRRVVGCSGKAISGVGGAGGRFVRAVDGRRSAAEEWRRRLRLGPEVVDGEGVDVVELRTQAVLLEVVVRLEVLGQWRSMMSSSWR